MPSAKPDKTLIKTTVRNRYGWERPSALFRPCQDAAMMAISDGCITPSRAAQLQLTFATLPHLDYFPYNIMQRVLDNALQPGCWDPAVERDLLIFISNVFAERDTLFGYSGLIAEDLPTMGDIYPQLFDRAPADLSLAGKLCHFTGAFNGLSRKQCYELITTRGGIPSDDGWYTDCFFVANDHYHKRAISNGFAAAIAARATYGITRIYRESAFQNNE